MQQVDQQLSEARQAVKLCTISEVLTTISVNYTSPEISLYNGNLTSHGTMLWLFCLTCIQ
jgi:hypothetical protein